MDKLSTYITLSFVAAIILIVVSGPLLHSQESMEDKKPATVPPVTEGLEVATFGAGCYWCVEAVYQRLDGVESVVSGFSNGQVEDPSYEAVCSGTTGHVEVVRVLFNPEKVSYETLLEWFWRLHDPTQLNRQGNDVGTQYRSGIYYHNEEQMKIATAAKKAAQEHFSKSIVSEIVPAEKFYPAKISHQDYYKINGSKNPYCRAVITPKLKKLKLE